MGYPPEGAPNQELGAHGTDLAGDDTHSHGPEPEEQREVRHCAEALIARFGAFAPFTAWTRAEQGLARGDPETATTWRQVEALASQLLRESPAPLLPD